MQTAERHRTTWPRSTSSALFRSSRPLRVHSTNSGGRRPWRLHCDYVAITFRPPSQRPPGRRAQESGDKRTGPTSSTHPQFQCGMGATLHLGGARPLVHCASRVFLILVTAQLTSHAPRIRQVFHSVHSDSAGSGRRLFSGGGWRPLTGVRIPTQQQQQQQ